MKPHINNLTWEEFVHLHSSRKIDVRVRLSVATHVSAHDPRVSGRHVYNSFGCLGFIMALAAFVSWIWIHWLWCVGMLLLGAIILSGTRQAGAQAVCAALLDDSSLYYDLLELEALYIYEITP